MTFQKENATLLLHYYQARISFNGRDYITNNYLNIRQHTRLTPRSYAVVQHESFSRIRINNRFDCAGVI